MSRPDLRPNVLLLLADDHRGDAIGALGHPVVRTPVIDGLVAEGTAFTRACIMGSLMPAVSAPSRACLLTGRHLFRADSAPALVHGPHYEVRLPDDARTLPECFRAAGYDTFVSGKWHNDLPSLLRSFSAGKNIFHGGMCEHTRVPVRDLDEIRRGAAARTAAGFSSEIFCGSAEEFIRERAGAPRRPFFAWIALTSPHDPRTPPPAFRRLYDPASIPLPGNFRGEHGLDNGALDIRDERLAPRPLTPEVLREHLADYYGMISHHDAAIGHVLAALRETGEAERTIVAYLSDHGLALGSHGLLGKQNLYEHSVRVPLVLRGPGVPRGQRSETLAYSFDLFATLCELAGVGASAGIDSRSLVPAFGADSPSRRKVLCSAYMDCQRMITDGRWKLIVYRVDRRERLQLFDLERDALELEDLAARPTASARRVLKRLAARLAQWQVTTGDRWMAAPSLAAGRGRASAR